MRNVCIVEDFQQFSFLQLFVCIAHTWPHYGGCNSSRFAVFDLIRVADRNIRVSVAVHADVISGQAIIVPRKDFGLLRVRSCSGFGTIVMLGYLFVLVDRKRNASVVNHTGIEVSICHTKGKEGLVPMRIGDVEPTSC